MERGIYQQASGFTKLFIVGLIVLVCLLLATGFSIVYTHFNETDAVNTETLRILLLIQNSFLFIVSSVAACYFLWKAPIYSALHLTFPKFSLIILGCLAIFCSGPIIDLLHTWNQGIHLPEGLKAVEQWIIDNEKIAEEMTARMLDVNNWGDFMMNILVIAILAGIGEELLFRGILQKIFIEWTNNIHLGIFITAFIFSFIHLQFFGFLPRLALGVLLGYLYVESRSLWVPIIAHTFNNALVVIITPNQLTKEYSWIERIDTVENSWVFVLISGIFVTIWMVLLHKISNRQKSSRRRILRY